MPLNTKTITLGPIAAAAATGIAAAQSGTAGTNLTLSGSLVTGGVATMDVARRVIITSVSDESAHTFLLTGTDRYGRVQSETITGAAALGVAQSVKDYLTVTAIKSNSSTTGNVSSGTNGVASSDAYICDWVPNGNLIGFQGTISGTVNYTVQECMDDYAPSWDQVANTFNWFDDATFASKAAAAHGTLSGPFTAIRITLNSGTGGVTGKFITPFIGGGI